MAIHQRINHGNFDNVDMYLPHNGSGRIKMLVSGGANIKFHKPQGSRLSMLINGKQRVEL